MLKEIQLTQEQVLLEFDQWVTPTLGDLRQTDKFRTELDSIATVIEGIHSRVRAGSSHSESILEEAFEALLAQEVQERRNRLNALITFIYLATARSDNAVKCQYPIEFLKKNGDQYPRVTGRKVVFGAVPNIIKSTDLVTSAIRLSSSDHDIASDLLQDYLEFLVADNDDRSQTVTLIDAYARAEAASQGEGRKLIAPLVAFQVRGSVAASGGHNPEEFVRAYFRDWGLLPNVHFNLADVTAQTLVDWLAVSDETYARLHSSPIGQKTRAFDFIVPFQSAAFESRIFVQSQFYAGDSGSVSHKNVDQAAGARQAAALLFPSARFVELVDGAGYCASLRRDLQHLLFATDTHGFSQLRSIPIRLRRLLQQSGIFSPLDLALQVSADSSSTHELLEHLEEAGVSPDSARIQVEHALIEGWLECIDDTLVVSASKSTILSEYRILDALAENGRALNASDFEGGVIMIPGYGPNYGLPRGELNPDFTSLAALADKGLVSMTRFERI